MRVPTLYQRNWLHTETPNGRVFTRKLPLDPSSLTDRIVQWKRTAETDEKGAYEFKDVPPGTYTVLAQMDGVPDLAKTVTVHDPEVTAGFVRPAQLYSGTGHGHGERPRAIDLRCLPIRPDIETGCRFADFAPTFLLV
jgi:hypothetical protein